MDSQEPALRAQDFHEALKDTASFGPIEVAFGNTILIGKAATLAMHLKGLIFIDDYQSLQYAAAELGISGIELQRVLQELEILDFISVIRNGSRISRIDIRVPEFRSGYEDLSRRWTDLSPTETEAAGIDVLSKLLTLPMTEKELQGLGISDQDLSIMQDVMKHGQLIQSQVLSGERLTFSPLAVDNNPAAYLRWSQIYKDDVGTVLNTLGSNQGLPLSSNLIQPSNAVNEAVATGVLMPVTVNGATGTEQFLFAPRGGLSPDRRIIMDKARAILASVRYGQNFAAGRPIKYPRAILQQLRDSKQFKRGHPDLESQYSLLVEKLIGVPIKTGSNRWNFKIQDTEENMSALNLAIDMLELGQTPTASINRDAQKALLTPRGYRGPITSRPRLTSQVAESPATRADIMRKLSNLSRGVVDA